jgi:serine/threonine protein kinase
MLISKSGNFVLADFGSARQLDSSAGADLTVGESPATVGYYPPEICVLNPPETHSGVKADIYALGISVICTIDNRLPYNAESLLDLVDSIASCDLMPYIETLDCPDCINAISILSHREPYLRNYYLK